MNKINLSLIVGALVVVQTLGVKAQFTDASLSTTPLSLNLNNYQAFAYYGTETVSAFQPDAGTVSTDLHNVGKFTGIQLVTSAGQVQVSGPHDTVPVTYTNGQGSETSESGDQRQSIIGQGGNGAGLMITSTLFAPVETFQFYVTSSATKIDFFAILADPSHNAVGDPFQLTAQVLPTTNSFTNDGDATGNGSKDGLLTFTVTGDIGDVLTFSDMLNSTGVSSFNPAASNVGIIAADVVASAPEPSTWALLFGGLALLVGIQRFRKLA